jgi:hypothetical protein
MGSTAGAIVSYPLTITGCTALKKSLGQCTIFVDGILKGLGNVTNNPTVFTATMFRMSGQVFCKNPAGNSSTAQGQPFIDLPVGLIDLDTIDPGEVTKNGKSLAEVVFHDAEILAAIDPETDIPDCQNSNWIKVVVITKMQILGRQLEDSGTGTCDVNNPATFESCTIVDSLRVSCQIQPQYFTTPGAAIGKSYSYGAEGTGTGSCTQICHSNDPTGDACSTTSP